MKKLKLFVIAILFTCSLFAVLPAGAAGSDDPNAPCSGGDPDNPCGVSSSSDSSSLPIDDQVWFLIAAAAIVGTKVIVSKSKAAKVAAAPVQ